MDHHKKVQLALRKAEAFLGTKIELIPETQEEIMREAQSVINYFDVKGEQFKHIECRQCGLLFAYSYHYDGVKYCSIPCIKRALKERGLTWNPSASVEDRYGTQFVPAVVPPSALKSLSQILQNDIPEDHKNSTSPE